MQRMMRLFPSRLILVTVVVSLLVGGIGSATAARLITGKQIKNGSIQYGDLSKSTRKKLRGRRGASGAAGAQGAAGAKGDKGDTGATGAPGSSVGYARVFHDGSGVDETFSKNVADGNVSKSGSVICFNGLPFTPKHVQATVDWAGGLGDTVIHASLTDVGSCVGTEQASVRIVDASDGSTPTVTAFYILFE